MSTPPSSTDAVSSSSSVTSSTSSPPSNDAHASAATSTPTTTTITTSTPVSTLSPAASLLSLIESSGEPIIYVESSDHMLLALPLPIARRCHALITKHLHSDLTEHGTALITTVTGEAMQRCVGYVQHEWTEIEKRKEKLAVIMKARGQKGSDKMGVGGVGEGQEKEGGGRRGKDREKNLLASVAKAQQKLVDHFQSMSQSHSHASASPSLPQFPPQALGVSPPSHPLASLLAPSSTIPTSPPSLAYSINHLLCELASSAYYLEIPPLVDLTCQRLADSIQGKSAEEIRTTFNITNDFTPMEEEQVKQRVMERTLLYPGGIDDGRPGDRVPVGEEERGLMAGLQAGLGGAAGGGGVGGIGGGGRLGVREQLKVKLAEKRMAQLRERAMLPGAYSSHPAASAEERKAEMKRADESADSGGAAGGSNSKSKAAKKKKKKKSKTKGVDGEEEKEPPSPPSPASLSPSSSQQQRLPQRSEDEQKALVDGSTYQLLQSMASSLTSSVAALPHSNHQGKPVKSPVAVPPPPLPTSAASALDAATASELRQFTVSDLCDPHEPLIPLFPPRVYPDSGWHHLRLLLKCAVSTSGLQWLRPYFPTAVYMYVGLTMGPSSASPLLHVCYDSEAALMSAVQSQLLGVLYPLLCAPPTVLSDMGEMWSSGRLMRCCDWCGLSGHMRGWEGCGMKDAGDGYVSRSLAVEEANPQPAQLMTLRFVFRLALTSAVLIPLSGLLPHALFLHLGFHPLYKTPTHVLHVTFSSSAAMQTCLLSDVPSVLHLMHTPPRIHLMDVSGYDVRDACPQCGEMGRHSGGECDVERDSRGLDPLSAAMLPPTSFAAFTAPTLTSSTAPSQQQPKILTVLSRVIDGGKANDEMKRATASTVSRTSSDDEDDVDDTRPLSELIDAKLMGLQQWEQHQHNSAGNEHGIDIDRAVAEMDARSTAADQSAFSASTLSSFFCACTSPSPSIPLSSSALMSDLARCPFSPLLLNTMSLCSHCGLLLSSAASSSTSPLSPAAHAALTADMQAMLMDADPAVLASLPYPLSAMFQQQAGAAGAKVEEQKDHGSGEAQRRVVNGEEADEGVRSIQQHSVGLPPLLNAAPADNGSGAHQHAVNDSPRQPRTTHPAASTPSASSPPPARPATASHPSSCSDCLRLQSQMTEQSSYTTKLLRLLEEQQKMLAALQDRVKKTEERESKRREKWEERVKAIEKMDERLKVAERAEVGRKEAAVKLERRLGEESKRRADLERWVEEETREKEEREKREKREREIKVDEERRDGEKREADEKRERADMRRLQSKWAEWERRREEQWSEFTTRMEKEREKDRVEQRAELSKERKRWEEDERRRFDERMSQQSGQLQLHGDVLVRVDRKLQSMEQMLLSSDRVMSRQRMAELIGFDISDN